VKRCSLFFECQSDAFAALNITDEAGGQMTKFDVAKMPEL
jgi:hypothetical protein